MFAQWDRVRDGTLSRRAFWRHMRPVRRRVEGRLRRGTAQARRRPAPLGECCATCKNAENTTGLTRRSCKIEGRWRVDGWRDQVGMIRGLWRVICVSMELFVAQWPRVARAAHGTRPATIAPDFRVRQEFCVFS
jgi:hypothetical protein